MNKAKNQDYEYLHANSRIWGMERRLLTADVLDRMIDYRTEEEFLKALGEYGYDAGTSVLSAAGLEAAVSHSRAVLLDELEALAPDKRVVDVFRVRYDYHNVKTLLKATVTGEDCERILIGSGRYALRAMREAVLREDNAGLSESLYAAIAEAKDVLGRTNDAQLTDLVLDKAMYREIRSLVEQMGSVFFIGYVKLQIDAVNLRTLVRSALMRKDVEFVRASLIEGGNIAADSIVSFGDLTGSLTGATYTATALENAAAAGLAVIESGGSLTRFEKLCDDALVGYLKKAHMMSFGEGPLIAFVAAKEAEVTAVRTVVSGRLAGVPGPQIRERLRETYV